MLCVRVIRDSLILLTLQIAGTNSLPSIVHLAGRKRKTNRARLLKVSARYSPRYKIALQLVRTIDLRYRYIVCYHQKDYEGLSSVTW